MGSGLYLYQKLKKSDKKKEMFKRGLKNNHFHIRVHVAQKYI